MSAVREARIATRCPSCGSSTLVIGSGNWLVCSLIGCKDPTLINSVGDRLKVYWDDREAVQRDLATVQGERDRLREALSLCVDRLIGLSEDGLTKIEQVALSTAQAALAQPAAPSDGWTAEELALAKAEAVRLDKAINWSGKYPPQKQEGRDE